MDNFKKLEDYGIIGMINSALYLGRAGGKVQMGPEPLG